jgi:hypothetical protein
MERWKSWLAVGILATFAAGCGKSQSSATGAAGQDATAAADATPDQAVKEFLSAARSGDQKRLTLLLSKASQEQAAKNNVNFELDSYQNATFEVGEFEYVTKEKDSARVGCKWTDRDTDGSEYTHPVVWVLRKEDSAWRIAGMILRPFPDKPPVVLNYEDMKALAEAKEYIEHESQRRMQEEQQQAARPLTAGGQPAAGQSPAAGQQQPTATASQAASTQQFTAGPQSPTPRPAETGVPQTAQRPAPMAIAPK